MTSGCEKQKDKIAAEFEKYCAEVFGLRIVFKKSDEPDTYESLFGDLAKDNTGTPE